MDCGSSIAISRTVIDELIIVFLPVVSSSTLLGAPIRTTPLSKTHAFRMNEYYPLDDCELRICDKPSEDVRGNQIRIDLANIARPWMKERALSQPGLSWR